MEGQRAEGRGWWGGIRSGGGWHQVGHGLRYLGRMQGEHAALQRADLFDPDSLLAAHRPTQMKLKKMSARAKEQAMTMPSQVAPTLFSTVQHT